MHGGATPNGGAHQAQHVDKSATSPRAPTRPANFDQKKPTHLPNRRTIGDAADSRERFGRRSPGPNGARARALGPRARAQGPRPRAARGRSGAGGRPRGRGPGPGARAGARGCGPGRGPGPRPGAKARGPAGPRPGLRGAGPGPGGPWPDLWKKPEHQDQCLDSPYLRRNNLCTGPGGGKIPRTTSGPGARGPGAGGAGSERKPGAKDGARGRGQGGQGPGAGGPEGRGSESWARPRARAPRPRAPGPRPGPRATAPGPGPGPEGPARSPAHGARGWGRGPEAPLVRVLSLVRARALGGRRLGPPGRAPCVGPRCPASCPPAPGARARALCFLNFRVKIGMEAQSA